VVPPLNHAGARSGALKRTRANGTSGGVKAQRSIANGGFALLLAALVGTASVTPVRADSPTAAAARATTTAVIAPGAGAPGLAEVVGFEEFKQVVRPRDGRAVVVHLWATWCTPCLQELPTIAAFAREMRARGVDVVSFSIDQIGPGTLRRVSKLIDEKAGSALSKKIVRRPSAPEFVAALDPRWEGSIPAVFAFDGNGVYRGGIVGEGTRAQLDTLVTGLVASR
jgi:thiol-disulfide isomerase/thioredoxin